jgi:hypothetical protein
MSHSPTRWKALAVILALTFMVGCQGFSAGKQASQNSTPGSQPAGVGGLSAAPTIIGFGSVQIGTSQTQSCTLSNTGAANTTISAVTTTGDGFSISGLSTPLTLTPGQTAAFSVIFAPQSSGNFSASVALTSDASNPSLTVALSGTGTQTAPAGQLAVTPSTINIGNVTVGSSGSQTGTLSASGESIVVSSVDVGSSEFTVSGLSLPATIPAGQSANFTVTFTPQASGVASVGISFASSAPDSPSSATVTGTGVATPTYTVSLSWNASNSQNVVGYNIYRRAGSTGSFAQINGTLDPVTTFTDTSVTDGLTYYYETTAVNSSNEESARSSAVAAAIPSP